MGLALTRALRGLLLAAVAACLLAPPAAADAARLRDITSVALHPWRLESGERPLVWALRDPALRERTFAELEALGVRRARVDLKWHEVEPSGQGVVGQLTRDWTTFDAIVASAAQHGIELMPIVSYVPGWANAGGHYFEYPHDMAAFETFFTAALARYPQIKAWEIWNEPNYSVFAKPKPDVGRFVTLLRAAHRARGLAGSQARLISGGLASVGEIGLFPFFDEFAAQGGLDYVDGLGVHPYGTAAPDRPGSLFLRLPELRARLLRLGKGHVKLWLTEYGVPNSTRTSGYGHALDEEGQAARLRSALALADGWDWIENFTWYEFSDACGDAAEPECRLGLLREDFTRKRAAFALRDALAGAPLPRFSTSTTVKVAAVRARPARKRGVRRKPRRPTRLYRARGSVFAPALDLSGRRVEVSLARLRKGRSAKRVRSLKGRLAAGRYNVRLGQLRRGRYLVKVRFGGAERHAASTASRRLSVR